MEITTAFPGPNRADKAKSLTHIINKECHKYPLELAEDPLSINRALKRRIP